MSGFSNDAPKPMTVQWDGGPGSGPQSGGANSTEEANKAAYRKEKEYQWERLKKGLGGPSRITGR